MEGDKFAGAVVFMCAGGGTCDTFDFLSSSNKAVLLESWAPGQPSGLGVA